MAPVMKHLSPKCEDLGSNPRTHIKLAMETSIRHSFVATTKLEAELEFQEFSGLRACCTCQEQKPFLKQEGRKGLTPD